MQSPKAVASYEAGGIEVFSRIASRSVPSVEQTQKSDGLKLVSVGVEVLLVGTKPPAAVGERISKDRIHDLGAASPPSTKTSSLSGRSGGSASMPKFIEVIGPS